MVPPGYGALVSVFWVFVVVLAAGLLLKRLGRERSSRRPALQCPYDLTEPPPGPPVVVSVAFGHEISFSVQIDNVPHERVGALLGEPVEGRVERPVPVLVARDYAVRSTASIRVDTVDGQPIGYVPVAEAAVPGILIGKIMADLPAHHPEVADRPLVIRATAQVAGTWTKHDGSLTPSLASLVVMVKDPAEIDVIES